MTLNILALAKQVEELVKNGGSGGTSDYEQLSKKPKINSTTLIGNKSAHDLGLATEEAVGAKSAKADIATEFSTETSYTAGNFVYYEGTLYIFNVDHAAGAWDIADVAVANVTDEVTSNKAAIDALDTAVSGKSTVTANPEGTSAGDLSSIGINGTKYNIPSGGGGTESVLYDSPVSVASGSTGAGWDEIASGVREELFENNVLKYKKALVEVSLIFRDSSDLIKTFNFSTTVNLDELLVDDARDYTDPEYYNTETNTHQAFMSWDYYLGSGSERQRYTLQCNLNFNQFGTDTVNDTYSARLIGVYFEHRDSSGNYAALPAYAYQNIRMKVTAIG